MKIVYVITRSDTLGGAQIHVRDMALRMMKEGHEVVVVVGGKGIYYSHLKEAGVNVIESSTLHRHVSLLGDMASLVRIVMLLKSLKPDLVSLHSVKAGLLGRLACFIVRYNCIFTAHGWSHIRTASGISKRILVILERLLIKVTDNLITVCKADYDYAKDVIGLPAQRLTVVHNGMPPIDTGNIVKQKGTVTLVTVARFQQPKDHLSLFLALNELAQENWVLVCVGDGTELESAKSKVRELNLSEKVRFLGYRENVPEILAASDVYVLSSLSEGFPRSIIEAMRAALPVVASDVGGISESVSDGETGYLFPPRDVSKLAGLLGKLILDSDLRGRLGSEAYRTYKQKFSFDAMFDRTLSVYRTVCENR